MSSVQNRFHTVALTWAIAENKTKYQPYRKHHMLLLNHDGPRLITLEFLKYDFWNTDTQMQMFSFFLMILQNINNHFISSCQPKEYSTVTWIAYSFLEDNSPFRPRYVACGIELLHLGNTSASLLPLVVSIPKKPSKYPDQSLFTWRIKKTSHVTASLLGSKVLQSWSPMQGVSGWGTGWSVGRGTSVELLTSTSTH